MTHAMQSRVFSTHARTWAATTSGVRAAGCCEVAWLCDELQAAVLPDSVALDPEGTPGAVGTTGGAGSSGETGSTGRGSGKDPDGDRDAASCAVPGGPLRPRPPVATATPTCSPDA